MKVYFENSDSSHVTLCRAEDRLLAYEELVSIIGLPADRQKQTSSSDDLKRKEAGFHIKGIASKDMIPYLKKRPKFLNMRYTSLPFPENMSIVENNVFIVSWEEKPVSFLIKSKQIADSYRRLFNQIWNLSKK